MQMDKFTRTVQSFSHVWLFATPWIAACQASLSFTISRGCSNSCPLSWWCHPTISCSVFPFSSCLQSFPASGSFPVSQFFASGVQSIGVSASASGLPMNIQNIFKMGIWYNFYCYAVWFIFFYNVISIPVSVYISMDQEEYDCKDNPFCSCCYYTIL